MFFKINFCNSDLFKSLVHFPENLMVSRHAFSWLAIKLQGWHEKSESEGKAEIHAYLLLLITSNTRTFPDLYKWIHSIMDNVRGDFWRSPTLNIKIGLHIV